MDEFESKESINKTIDIIKREKLISLHNDLKNVISHFRYTNFLELGELLFEIKKIRTQMDIIGYENVRK